MISDEILENAHAGSFTKRQQLFLKYSFLVLIDIIVLNLFDEYWELVHIEYFSISLLTAILFQVLLQITIVIEHKAANYFKKQSGVKALILRGLSTWGILFISKLVILWAINVLFGDSVLFTGPIHGVVSFITVVIAILFTEQLFYKSYHSLS